MKEITKMVQWKVIEQINNLLEAGETVTLNTLQQKEEVIILLEVKEVEGTGYLNIYTKAEHTTKELTEELFVHLNQLLTNVYLIKSYTVYT